MKYNTVCINCYDIISNTNRNCVYMPGSRAAIECVRCPILCGCREFNTPTLDESGADI